MKDMGLGDKNGDEFPWFLPVLLVAHFILNSLDSGLIRCIALVLMLQCSCAFKLYLPLYFILCISKAAELV